jgi:hypothetical protein
VPAEHDRREQPARCGRSAKTSVARPTTQHAAPDAQKGFDETACVV